MLPLTDQRKNVAASSNTVHHCATLDISFDTTLAETRVTAISSLGQLIGLEVYVATR